MWIGEEKRQGDCIHLSIASRNNLLYYYFYQTLIAACIKNKMRHMSSMAVYLFYWKDLGIWEMVRTFRSFKKPFIFFIKCITT